MKKSMFKKEQITFALRQTEWGTTVGCCSKMAWTSAGSEGGQTYPTRSTYSVLIHQRSRNH